VWGREFTDGFYCRLWQWRPFSLRPVQADGLRTNDDRIPAQSETIFMVLTGDNGVPYRLDRRRFIANMSATAVGAAIGFFSATTAAAGQELLGDLTGKFVFDGDAPEQKKLKVDKDIECCGKFDIRDESLIVGETGGLANVYVRFRFMQDLQPLLARRSPSTTRTVFSSHTAWESGWRSRCSKLSTRIPWHKT
jgi:hypothetical protein